MTKEYSITAPVWIYPGDAAWHFVSIPSEVSDNIDFYFSHVKGGWGSLKVTVTLGETTWKTSIFPEKKKSTYFLPLKKEVRKIEQVTNGDTITFLLEVRG